MGRQGSLAVLAVLPALALADSTSPQLNLTQLIARCAPTVAAVTMKRIVQHESAGNPLVIHVNGPAQLVRQPRTETEAVVTAEWLLQHDYNIDVGLGQLNSATLVRYSLPITQAFSPCRNLATAAAVLGAGYGRAVAHGSSAPLTTALSYYNTGSPTAGIRNGYAAQVLATPIPLAAGASVTHTQLLPPPAAPATASAAATPPAWDVFTHPNHNVFDHP